MSIYSTNRAGAVASIDVVANESYRASDIGRIMYEAQINDMAIFEATLKADFAEINGIREGTMLESEIAAFNEANAKAIFEHVKATLKKFWEKIKGVFKNAIQKFAAYVLRDGKAYAAEFQKFAKEKTFKGEIKEARYQFNSAAVTLPDKDLMDKALRGVGAEYDKSAETAKALGKAINEPECDRKEFRSKAIALCLGETVDISESNAKAVADKCCEIISSNAIIKGLKEAEAKANKDLADLNSTITAGEKAVDEHNKKGDKEAAAKVIKNITIAVSVYEDVIALITSTKIAAAKTAMSNARSILAKIKSGMSKDKAEEAVAEAAVIEAEDEVEEALDDDLATPADDETQAEIEKLVDEA